jgi:hypothetical protein
MEMSVFFSLREWWDRGRTEHGILGEEAYAIHRVVEG